MLDASAPWSDTLTRLAAAVLCGALLGWNRESHTKPAGLRTNILVALGGALFTIVGVELSAKLLSADATSGDPIRVVSGIVGGVGFLGAATVIRDRRGVEGITTAATIWLMAGIGVACGIGAYRLAATATGIALFTLSVLGYVTKTWGGSSAQRSASTPGDEFASRDRQL